VLEEIQGEGRGSGRSNQEIADGARLSLPMVKKHLHAVFRKLEVNSRSQLVALML